MDENDDRIREELEDVGITEEDIENVTCDIYVKCFIEKIKNHIDKFHTTIDHTDPTKSWIIEITIPSDAIFSLDEALLDPNILFFEYKGFILSRMDDNYLQIVKV